MMMRIKHILLFVAIYMSMASAFADVIYGNVSINTDTTVGADSGYMGEFLNVNSSLHIINNGIITSTINVCNNCDLFVHNRGTFDANVVLGMDATLTQIINMPQDVNELMHTGVGYSVSIADNNDVLDWDDISSKTQNATRFVLSNAKLRMDDIQNINNLVINNDLFIYTDSVPVGDELLFSNVSGNGVVHVVSNGVDALHTIEAYRSGGDIFVHTIRATNYSGILNNGVGQFLDKLRITSPDDKLLKRVDAQETIGALRGVLSHSVRVNPIKLETPIRVMHSHKMLEFMHIADDYQIGLMPYMVLSGDMNLFGAEPNISINLFGDLNIRLFGRVAYLEYMDDINEYSAMHYAAGADAFYKLPMNYFVRGYGEFGLTMFDTGIVFDGANTTHNPNGYSLFGAVEFGRRFTIENGVYISPFVFADTDFVSVLNDSDFNTHVGIGGDVGYAVVFDGFRYNYAMRAIARNRGIGAEIGFSVLSIADNVGADAKIGIFNDNVVGTSYNVSLNGIISF